MVYSTDSFMDFAIEVEDESRAVVVTDPVGTRPLDAGCRTEQMLESLLTKLTDLTRGTAAALDKLGQSQEELSNRLTSLERSRQSSRQSSRKTSRQSSRASTPNPNPCSLGPPSRITEKPVAFTTNAPFVTSLNLDLPPASILAGNALVPNTVPLRRSARLLSKMRPDYRLVGRSEEWSDRRTYVKEPSRGQGPQEPEDLLSP